MRRAYRRYDGRRELLENGDQLSVRGRAAVAEGSDRVRLGQAVEPREQANALSTSKLGLGRAPSEEQAIEFAIADEHIELMCRDVDKEQHHQPQLN